MSIKTATEGYVHIKLFQLFGEKCIPTGKKRTTGNETEAEFILISPGCNQEKIWLKREDIY